MLLSIEKVHRASRRAGNSTSFFFNGKKRTKFIEKNNNEISKRRASQEKKGLGQNAFFLFSRAIISRNQRSDISNISCGNAE